MNDTQHLPPPQQPPGTPPPPPDDEFDPRRLRTVTDVQRSSDDRVVAGVCAGAARYLNVDPVVVRVVVAVLTIAGFAGAILYVAAWILLPSDDAEKSLAAEWFRLDRNEPQVRVAGLVGAAVLAVLSIVGDSSWAWWGDTAWWLVPFALVLYVVWLRPRRRRHARAATVAASPAGPSTAGAGADADATVPQPTPAPTGPARAPRSPALVVLTTSVAAIALAATWIYDETQRDVHWTTYVAVALAVVAVGLLVGTVVGDGGPLIAIGLVLAVTLAIGSLFPSGRIGSQTPTPTVAADVRPTYRHGVGELELDLTRVSDVERLAGRTISIDAGIGQTTVVVPDGLLVDVGAHVRAGQIDLFGRLEDGTDVSLADVADRPDGSALRIDIDQDLGQIEVISR
ncbi:PspC domain-containing protein [Aeromicrobium sp. CFBP 8757]|uniref:PspC domain-containing protein n=1 Tax=Aeromicrobium sp. CFBP 8757 TaxID=2775288 RepID=UPI00178007DA|nr:PspC domain-containing protein [Aeromicrobium sp. CFBP 8757]MBD8607152.1 PspC domain-containing protein [Aeromicrobium sp. CFBP 8757]